MRPTLQPIAGASGMTAAPPQQRVQWDWGREHGRPSSVRWCWEPCQRLVDPSDPPTPPASTEFDGTGKALTECQDISCLSTSLLVKQPEEFTTTSVTNNEKGTTTTADSEGSAAVSHTISHLFLLVTRASAAAVVTGAAWNKWCALNINEGKSKLPL
ncbi:putative trans-sialidase [Trypanosoma cruzi]|nr:putative trans-sialidase [Trypanosoma cruzi]